MDIIKFRAEDLLNAEELEKLVISIFPSEKAEIIKNKLMNYVLLTNSKEWYKFDIDNILYFKHTYDDNKLMTLISILIQESFNTLSKEETNLLSSRHKSYIKIFKNSSVTQYIPQIKTFLTNTKIDFNALHDNEIHFKNGYYDFKTGLFQKRIINKHFITHFINRDYKIPTNNEIIDRVHNDLNKIYPKSEDKNYLLMQYGIALTGKSGVDQSTLFLVGKGLSGKSTIIEMCKLSLTDYTFTLPKDSFSKNYKGVDKVMNSYLNKSNIRISHINEPEEKQLDVNLLKNFCDGKIQTTSLFQDGSNNFEHYSKLIFTCNTYPNIKIDSGSERRVDSYTHGSFFCKKIDEVDESKNIYLGDLNFLNKMAEDTEYLNAFFTILAEYGHNWINNKKIYEQTDNFKNTKNEIIGSNDIIQDFIDKRLVFTNNMNDVIGKEDMLFNFNAEYPKEYMKQSDLLNRLKDKKQIIYDSQKRYQNVRGIYKSVKFYNDNHIRDDDNDDNIIKNLYPNKGKIEEDENLLQEKDNEIKRLNDRIIELEKYLLQSKQEKDELFKKSMKPIIKEVIEEPIKEKIELVKEVIEEPIKEKIELVKEVEEEIIIKKHKKKSKKSNEEEPIKKHKKKSKKIIEEIIEDDEEEEKVDDEQELKNKKQAELIQKDIERMMKIQNVKEEPKKKETKIKIKVEPLKSESLELKTNINDLLNESNILNDIFN